MLQFVLPEVNIWNPLRKSRIGAKEILNVPRSNLLSSTVPMRGMGR